MTISALSFRSLRMRSLAPLCLLLTFPVGTLFGQRPQVSAQALSTYKRGKAAELAKNPKAAIAAYQSALRTSPQMIEALNDLAYLQATSTDPTVRNPRAALTNAGKLLDMYYKQFINRRKVQSADAPRLPASFYRVVVPNTFAAVYAANGRIDPPMTMQRAIGGGGGCAPGGRSTALLAHAEAQTLVARQAPGVSSETVDITKKNLELIESGKPVLGVPQPPAGQ